MELQERTAREQQDPFAWPNLSIEQLQAMLNQQAVKEEQLPVLGLQTEPRHELLGAQQQGFTGQWQMYPAVSTMSDFYPDGEDIVAFTMMQGLVASHSGLSSYDGNALPCSAVGATFEDDRRMSKNFDDDEVFEDSVGSSVAAMQRSEPDPVIGANEAVLVSTRVEHAALPLGEPQDIFGLVTLQAIAPQGPAERQPTDIVCVLDVSGSMAGHKIRQVQSAMHFVIDQADPRDRLSIVSFSDVATRPLPLLNMHAAGKDNAHRAVRELMAGGGTSIAQGLSTGLAVMEQRRQRRPVSAILLLTDGQDDIASCSSPQLISRAERAHCALYTFGFGHDHDAGFLRHLAEQAHTPFSFVEDSEQKIREAFAGAVGGLTSVVAQEVVLSLKCQVDLKTLHTPFATKRTSSRQATVTIPDLFAGERRDILVELSVPSVLSNSLQEYGQIALLEATVQYIDLQRKTTVESLAVTMEVERVRDRASESEPDPEVCEQRHRVEVTLALKEAAAQSDRREFAKAQQTLGIAERRLKQNRLRSRAIVALEQQLQDAQAQMQSETQWESFGRAMAGDAYQMHSVQRCTNIGLSPHQDFYCLPQQASMIELSRES